MKKLLLLFFSFCLYASVSAQKVYFMYLETGNNTPFYVRMGDKVYSSSEPGYLLLPNLVDSSYTFFIGLPSVQQKEAKFEVTIKGADRGFAIKNLENGLNLFDLQNAILIKPLQDPARNNVTYEPRSDAFTALLSKASGDSSLLLAPVFAKAELPRPEEKKQEVIASAEKTNPKPGDIKPKKEAAKPNTEEVKPKADDAVLLQDGTAQQKKPDSLKTVTSTEVAHVEKPEIKASVKDSGEALQTQQTVQMQNNQVDSAVAVQTEEYQKSEVKRYSESSTSEGFGLVYFDKHGETVDTIRLTIPNPKIIFKTADTVKHDDNMFLQLNRDSLQQAPSNNTEAIKKSTETSAKERVTVAKPAKAKCENQATENDFFKLRKNMAAEETDEAMVNEAKKAFKNKCFTTEQVKYLSALFLTSAGKYLFFDAAFMHVSDREQFASLQSEIKDDYYLRRFKALIGE